MNALLDAAEVSTLASIVRNIITSDSVVIPASSAIIAAILGATVVCYGNYLVQYQILHRFRKIDETKDKLYQFANLVSRYWATGGMMTTQDKINLEIEIVNMEFIISSDLYNLKRQYRRIRLIWEKIESLQVELFDLSSGGSFNSIWNQDMDRARKIAKTIARLSILLR